MLEAAIPSSFSRLFYRQFWNTWRWIRMYTHNQFRGWIRICYTVTSSFFASFRKHYLDFLANLRKKTQQFFFSSNCNDQQMASWHHRDSVRESRTKLHQIHLFVTWSTHTTDGFWHVFRSMGSFNLMKKNSWTRSSLVPVSLLLKTKQRNQNRYFT